MPARDTRAVRCFNLGKTTCRKSNTDGRKVVPHFIHLQTSNGPAGSPAFLDLYGNNPRSVIHHMVMSLSGSVAAKQPPTTVEHLPDLRQPSIQPALVMRHRLNKVIRDSVDVHGFLELETPLLGRSTPEGARDEREPHDL